MALYGGQPHWVPPHDGPVDPSTGFAQTERGHWATPGGRWAKRPHAHTRPRPTPPVRQHPFDPMAPIDDAELRRRALQASQAELGPILDQIRQAIEARSQSGQAAIRGYTGALAGLLGQTAGQTKATYDEAIGQQSGVNNELANRLTSFGQNLGAETAQKLDYAPQSTQSNLAAGANNTATGTANANAAIGAADITRLISESAHGQEYGQKLPGIAAQQGLQHSADLERQLNAELADQLASASSKAQDTFSQLYLHYVDQEWQKTLARTSGQFKSAQAQADAKYRAQQLAYRKAELDWKTAKARADRAEKARESNARVGVSQQNANTAAQRAADANARAARAQRQQNLRQNKWQVNPDGTFKMRRNKKTGKMERIPIKPPRHNGSSSSGL